MHVKFQAAGERKNRIDLSSDQTFSLTEANHVHCEGKVEINGVALTYSTHLYRKADGSWVPDSKMREKARAYDDVYLRRDGSFDDPPSGARSKAIKELPAMVAAILQGVENLDELRKQAEQEALERRIASKSSDLAEAKQLVAQLESALSDLDTRLKAADKGDLENEYRHENV